MKLYPAEFYILMTNFEEYTPIDVVSQVAMLSIFLTKDWALEYIRSRLTEVYDREFVDKLLPYQREHYFDLGWMETITDEELEEHGFYVPGHEDYHFDIDESLYHIRNRTKERIDVDSDFPKSHFPYPDLLTGWEALGSNCWAIHGNHTKSGKPMMSCDPHLGKFTNPTWYPARISWNETTTEQTENGPVTSSYRAYIAGHTVVGVPIFSHVKTPFLAGGVTSMNPDC